MTAIDLTKAVEAAANQLEGTTHGIWAETDTGYQCFCGHHSTGDRQHTEHRTQAALTAALPHIETALRAQIAKEIRAEADETDSAFATSGLLGEMDEQTAGMRHAARIAEGH